VRWPWRRKGSPTRAAQAAGESADASQGRAERDLARSRAKREEADRQTARLRRHNTANSYADWIRMVVEGDR
jgi:hypothetical protein